VDSRTIKFASMNFDGGFLFLSKSNMAFAAAIPIS
jgi:hypothetical protein